MLSYQRPQVLTCNTSGRKSRLSPRHGRRRPAFAGYEGWRVGTFGRWYYPCARAEKKPILTNTDHTNKAIQPGITGKGIDGAVQEGTRQQTTKR